MKSNATGYGSISAVFPSIVLLCVSSIIIIVIIKTIIIIITIKIIINNNNNIINNYTILDQYSIFLTLVFPILMGYRNRVLA